MERTLLMIVLAEIETFAELDAGVLATSHPEVRIMQQSGIPYRPRVWFGGPLAAAGRKAYSRAVDRLARAGLLLRITEPRRDRVACLRPTPRGLATALALAPSADHVQVAEGLSRIDWGCDLLAAVDDDLPFVIGPLPDFPSA